MKLLIGFVLFPLLLATNDITLPFVPNAIVSDVVTLAVSQFLPFLVPRTVVDSSNVYIPKDFLLVDSLIKEKGYGYELHNVITEDGYILALHRILPSNSTKNVDRMPVLMQHGVLASSDSWLAGPNSSLAFLLTDHGYDVWLGDQRGSFYSKAHTTYSIKDPEYWNFTFHESGMFDISAFIDHILKVTGKPKLFYIGHSMGTTVLLTMSSMRPEYNDKIAAAVLLAPVATTPTLSEIHRISIRLGILYTGAIKESYKRTHVYEFLPRNGELIKAIRNNCAPDSPVLDYCLDLIGIFYGEDRNNLDRNTIGKSASYLPSGTSIYTMDHLSQIYKSGFRLYDYGMLKNWVHYGSHKPPLYPLSKVTTPIALYYGENDTLMNKRSAAELASMLPNLIKNKAIPDLKFTHTDFLFGLNAKEMLYDDVINTLQSI